MLPVRERADEVLDTSELVGGDLRRVLWGRFQLGHDRGLGVTVTSFSFRHGLPREADLVFDVRFLDNPHYDPALRPLTGEDEKVGRAVESDPAFPGFFGGMTGLLLPLLPGFEREGKSYLTIAIGCTGGRHRSVHVARRLAQWLELKGRPVILRHRDLDRSVTEPAATGPAAPPSGRG